MSIMLRYSSIDNQWLEPAGGRGAFVEAMQSAGVARITSYDIEPFHPMVQKVDDFLLEDVSRLAGCTVLTNPPFGRANKLSVPFFNKCATVANHIGFLVPKSWRKWSVVNRLDARFHLVHDEDLIVDFIYPNSDNKSQGKLSTIFQVWEKRNDTRPKISIENRGYIEKTSFADADVSLTIFGRGCGTVKTNFQRCHNTTQMFLKMCRPWALEALQAVDYQRFCNNVAFVEALSIQEINFLLNEYADANKLS